MKDWGKLLAFGAGLATGLLLGVKLATPDAPARADAEAALQRAQDSLITLRAENVSVKAIADERERDLLTIKQIKQTRIETTYVTRVRDTNWTDSLNDAIDNMPGAITEGSIDTIPIALDTIWYIDTLPAPPRYITWDFRDETAAYKIYGTSVADMLRPEMSTTSYQLTIDRAAICPRTHRFLIGGGSYNGDLLATIGVRINRVWVMPIAGVHAGGGSLMRLGGMAAYEF